VTTRTTYAAAPAAAGKTTVAWLATAVVFAAAACAGSPSAVGGEGDSPGQAGSVSSSGAMTSGSGPTETSGTQITGGNDDSEANVAIGGIAVPGGQTGTGDSSVGGGGSGGSGSGGGDAGMGEAAGMGGGGGGATTATCSPARPHAMGSSTVNLQSGGMDRSYLLHIPPGYDGTQPLALVLELHGYSSFASEQLTRSKWDEMADKEGFVLIEAEGDRRSWNAGSCCGGNNLDDVKYFRDVVAKATAELCIDRKRVYVSGHSNGGAMTYRLACEAADIFAAAAPVCGWMTIPTCNPARPVPMLEIRALNDGTVDISGADADVNEWLSNDNCDQDQVTTSGVCKTYNSCEAGAQVMDCRPRGPHGFYYGDDRENPDNYLVPDNAWPFFKQFSLP
jgi:polyhydroxybutyrate depolymerase